MADATDEKQKTESPEQKATDRAARRKRGQNHRRRLRGDDRADRTGSPAWGPWWW